MRPRFIAPVVALASTAIALTGTTQAALKVTWTPVRTVSTSPS